MGLAALGAAAGTDDHPGTERVTPPSGTGAASGTAATLPQQSAGQAASALPSVPSTPPPGFGPAPAGFGPAPAGFAAEGRPTPPPGGSRTTQIGPVRAEGADRRKRRWLIVLATAAALVASSVGVVIAESGGSGNTGNTSGSSGQLPGGTATSPSTSYSASSSASASSGSGAGSTGNGGGTYVSVPSVLGQAVDYAKQELEHAGFSASAISVSYHCSSSGSGVYTQSPGAGSRAATDAQVRLTAYETDCVAYNDEVGKALSYAQSDLSGFSHVSVVYTCVSGATDGYVVSQSPQAGSASAYPPNQPITLKVQQSGCGSSSSSSASSSASASTSTSSAPAASASTSYSGSTSAQGGGNPVSGSPVPSATPTAS